MVVDVRLVVGGGLGCTSGGNSRDYEEIRFWIHLAGINMIPNLPIELVRWIWEENKLAKGRHDEQPKFLSRKYLSVDTRL